MFNFSKKKILPSLFFKMTSGLQTYDAHGVGGKRSYYSILMWNRE